MKKFYLLALCAALILSLCSCGWLVDVEDTPPPSDTAAVESAPEPPEETQEPEEPTQEPAQEPGPTAEAPPPRAEAIGVSDKDIGDLLTIKATTVRGDTTGNWRYSGFSEVGVDITEYALSYYNEYFSSDDELHAVINFATNTTYSLNPMAGMLFVSAYERVDGEEHDAGIMFTGLSLGEYIVYLDNGDIEKID